MTPIIAPFQIVTAQTDLDELSTRLIRTHWPDELSGVGWHDGVDSTYLRELVHYWATSYDWRRHEHQLNQLPQFQTVIDNQQVHFVHVTSTQPDAVPLLLTHGWPSTFADFQSIVGPLAEPLRHGGNGAPAFDLVIPSIPGYAYSGPTQDQGWDVARIGRAWAELMRRLGYSRYLVQG